MAEEAAPTPPTKLDTNLTASPSAQTPTTPTPVKSVTLPLTFANSFWSPDYRTGFERLYNQLEAAIVQSDEIIGTIQRRADAERLMSGAVMPPALRPDGFAIDEGASLKMGLEALLTSFVTESRARTSIAEELTRTILIPFEEWSNGHNGRVRSSRALLEGHLSSYEKRLAELLKCKSLYNEAASTADAAEDELAFVKGNGATSPPASTPSATRSIPPTPSSEDGIDPIEDEQDPNIIGRSGATGGSITAALGRAFSTRRKGGSGRGHQAAQSPSLDGARSPSDAPPILAPLAADPNVAAALDWSKSTFAAIRSRVAGPQSGEERVEKTRKEAEAAEDKYKLAVEALDSARMVLEEALSEHYTYVYRCELDRVRAAGSALRAFHSTVLRTKGEGEKGKITQEKVASALQLIRPERDVYAIIERLRTGPFQPRPTSYHSHYSEPAIHSFGIDLRKFDETNTAEGKVPPVLTFLLDYISERYPKVSDSERRKAWLYETPLSSQHHLRTAINNPNVLDRALIEKFDLPVLASTVKLWLLELEVPVIIFSHYDEYRTLYPKRVGAEEVQTPGKLIASHLARLPAVHLEVLRTLISHFHTLLTNTKTDEADEVYLQKLSLSVARCIVRPKQETALTLDDRFPALLFADLIRGFEEIFKAADELKERQREDRYKPRRQRTKPIDVRPSRTRIGVSESVSLTPDQSAEILKGGQMPPPVPALPSVVIPDGAPAERSLPSAPLAASPLEETPTATIPPAPLPASEPSTEATATAGGSGSLSRRDGRRGARGPRPLPASGAAPTSPPESEKKSLEFEASAPPAEDDGFF